jgi:hypothetical protein
LNFKIKSIVFEDTDGKAKQVFSQGEDIVIKTYWTADSVDVGEVMLGLRIDGPRNDGVSGFSSKGLGYTVTGGKTPQGSGVFVFRVKANRFGSGEYYLSFGVHKKEIVKGLETQLYYKNRICSFNIMGLKPEQESYIYEPEIEYYELD